MRYIYKTLCLAFIVMIFSGCVEFDPTEAFEKVDVVHVDVKVDVENNKTVISDIHARVDQQSKLKSPGLVIPDDFPAIYVEVLQRFENTSALRRISIQNGQEYNGPGNYSFTVQLYTDLFNRSRPMSVYSEVYDEGSRRIARQSIGVNLSK